MIYCLTGKIIKKTLNAVVLSCGGVGYFAQCPASVAGALPGVGKDATIYTVMSVTENDVSLYGFATEEQQACFEMLTAVSGVGPKVGLAIRACSYSEKASTLMGINGDLVIFIIFLMGGVLAGFAGMLYGMRFIVRPTIGQVTNKSFVAAVFGGLGSLPGAIVGSVLLGIMEIFVASFNSNLRDLFVYGLLILVLIIKPSGLMGKVVEDKA